MGIKIILVKVTVILPNRLILPFGGESNFATLTILLRSCRSCDTFGIFAGTRLEKWHQFLISLSKDLKYFNDIELVFLLDKF